MIDYSTAQDQELVEAWLNQADKNETSLLLYLETRAVDYFGLVASRHMNEDDMMIVQAFAFTGLIRFSQILSSFLKQAAASYSTHVVELSPFAWQLAATERRRRAERSQNKKIIQKSLLHFEKLKATGVTKAPVRLT